MANEMIPNEESCGDCGYSFYVLVPLGRKRVVGCPKCRSGRVGLMTI